MGLERWMHHILTIYLVRRGRVCIGDVLGARSSLARVAEFAVVNSLLHLRLGDSFQRLRVCRCISSGCKCLSCLHEDLNL